MFLRALSGYRRRWPDHTSTLDTVRNLGKLSADQGKTERARTMFQRVIVGQTEGVGASPSLYTGSGQ
jgi:hypothetical protein